MKQISNKEYEEFQKYKSDRAFGKILTPDGLRFIIEANDYDARKIGQHFLDMCQRSGIGRRRSMSDACNHCNPGGVPNR